VKPEAVSLRAGGADNRNMPSILAGLISTIVGWIVGDLLDPYVGFAAAFLISGAVSTLSFFYARHQLIRLKDGY